MIIETRGNWNMIENLLNVTVTFKSLEDSERERDIELMISA